MNWRRAWRRVRLVWVTLGISATVVFVTWSLIAYRASAEAHAAITSDSTVAVDHSEGVWKFTPRKLSRSAPALVFFPGALVDPVAYAPLTRAAAAAGFPAYIVELPRRGAFGGAEGAELEKRLDDLLDQSGTPPRWFAAGHSRGGVVASDVAAEGRTGLAGLILIGTSHPRDVDLSTLLIPVTKIVGTRDGLASREEVEANRSKLPPSTQWVWVEGGNHSQFGWYGFQPGDRRASVDASSQHRQLIQAVLLALSNPD